MTDKQLQKILDRTTLARIKYIDLLNIAENEVLRRYGVNPCDIDNDSWIDAFYQSSGRMTVKELDESMKLHMGIK